MDVSLAILGTGLLVFLAHLFAAAFDRASIPDVLPLMTIGLILGPLLGWISKDSFGEIGPIFFYYSPGGNTVSQWVGAKTL